ncbi:MAG: PKD domain-containing protein [Bacteroidota bacterium]|nr:PKD domain-containing protein [Bacteroidota bacterium]
MQSWYWEFVAGSTDATSEQRNPVYTYAEADSFLVKLLVTNKNGCYDSIVDTAVVNPLPDALFGWDLNCAGQPTYFTDLSDPAGAPIVSWWWNFGDTLTVRDTSSQQGPYYIYDSTGTYYPVLEVVNQNGCTGSFDTAIVVNPTPVAGFSFRENYDNVQGQLSFINESDSSALRYYWYFGEPGAESEEKDPVWQFDQDNYFTESYEIFLVSYNKYDCPDTAFYDYNFLFKGLFVPNAFAPTNPAAEVREFRPKGINLASYQVVVFDSWGNIIWESEELTADGQPAEGWDGTYNGEELPMDVYLWKIRASFLDGTVWDGKSIGEREMLEEQAMGTVTLIR